MKTLELWVADCQSQQIALNPDYNKFSDAYIRVGDSLTLTRYEQTWDNENGDLRSLCFPYTLSPVWQMSDGGFREIVDDSPDWVASFQQGNNVTGPMPMSPYQYDLEALN